MTLPITNYSDDECRSLWQRLRSDDEHEKIAALQYFVDNPGSFEALTARMTELSEGIFNGVDIREAVSTLARSEDNRIISQLLLLLDSADETIKFWIASGMEHKYYSNTVSVFLKYIGNDDEFISTASMMNLCGDEERFGLLSDERKNAIINSMFEVFAARCDKTVHDEKIAHTISNPLKTAIYHLAKLMPMERLDRLADKLLVMAQDEQIYVRQEAVEGLAEVAKRIKSEKQALYVAIERVLLNLFNDPGSPLRQKVLYALSQAKSEHAFHLALQSANDDDPAVQDFAIFLLRKYHPFTPKALRVLKRIKPRTGNLSHITDFKLSTFQKILSYIPFL